MYEFEKQTVIGRVGGYNAAQTDGSIVIKLSLGSL
jgi:hypothetical protein